MTPLSGGAFFTGYAEPTGSNWQAFGVHLSAFAQASGAENEVVTGANETLETPDRWPYPTQPQGTLHDELARHR